ncbi:signal peptidase I [Staphylococcus equorum]|uniref:signal peptidase I n=1 Tax=Staphylococcus equorum TaxID=246432 RepID=UPI000E69F2E6|nr:signal peptidase I [Staphylococcus equorum]RIL38259.1 signal peptidase I [Staphylococcus equorum]
MKKELLEWIASIIIAIAIIFVMSKFVASSYVVSGLSMYPTFDDKDRVVVSKISKTLHHLDNKDVIVFHENSKEDYIKRLIGKPGDIVEYKSDQLYVNGNEIKEPYLKYNKDHKYIDTLTEDFKSKDLKSSNGKAQIPKDKYLVLGDNRQNSKDSRSEEVGLIKEEQIVGKVVLRFWPLSDMKFDFNP